MSVSTFVRVIVLVALVLAMMPAPTSAAPAEGNYGTVSGNAYCQSGQSADGRVLTAGRSYSTVRNGRYYFMLPGNQSYSVYWNRKQVGTIDVSTQYEFGPTIYLSC